MTEQKKEAKKYGFDWGLELKPVYKPEDLKGIEYEMDVGNPGDYPYIRGTFPLMYRSRPPLHRIYSGFLSGEDTNARLSYLFERGMATMSIALDLPTQLGLDSDDPRAEDEVGRIGVAIDTLQDMEDVLKGIDLSKVSTNITINALAPILLSMYVAVGEKQGVGKDQISIVTQNDILKEYVVRGAWIFPPKPSLRTTVDVIEYCAKEIPKASPVSVAAGHIRSSGANAAQEIGWGFAIAFAYLQTALDRGMDVDQVASFITFTFHNKLNFFEEAAKYRAARRIWARLLKERFGAKNPRSLLLRSFGGGGMEELTMQEPLNNIIRETCVALGCILGGVQGIGLCCYDEAYTIPSPEAQLIQMRTIQILMEEANLGDVADPLGGSYYIERLTTELEKAIMAVMEDVGKAGGAVKAIEDGLIQRICAKGAYERQKQIDSGEKVWIGANKYVSEGEEWDVKLHEYDPSIRERQIQKLNRIREERDNAKVEKCLKDLRQAAESGTNIVPFTLEAVKAYATVGEMTGVLRKVFGEFKEPGIF
jgi:methylmalonyl-CoA mutase N-terminal domain/subunit